MKLKSTWWCCPKCKNHKMIDEDCIFIHCISCGSYFDRRGRQISQFAIKPGQKCDMS